MQNAIRDWRGRAYLPGPVPADRTRMFRLSWASLAAISPLQYGFAALLAREGTGLTLLAAWIACQAAGALPALHLVRRGRLGVRPALAAGAALSAAGLAAAALLATGGPAWPPALAGYALLGGLGAGLVYGVCGEVVASWYPERAAARVGLVTGAFGYGAVPLLVWAGLAPDAAPAAFLAAAAVAAAVVGAAAGSLRTAPALWWPAPLDPRTHALDAARLRVTPDAARQFLLPQALRTRALPALALILTCAGAVSVFDVVLVAGTAPGTGAWAAVALLVALNGAGRSLAMRCSELLGRRRVLAAVLGALALGQLLLLAAVTAGDPGGGPGGGLMGGAGHEGWLWPGVVAAGLGGGAFYPLLASLVREFFGVERHGEIHAVVYSAKALAGVGAAALAAVALSAPAAALPVAAALAALPALAALRLRLRLPGLPATLPA
ncbi:MFS transporter [Nonomuraea sp. NPDC050783]|uniref:MFS transporter n=1 Tax=Nonomuraea sp. NPDC050783 TaxID=3154634 RepID=UPI0034650A1C